MRRALHQLRGDAAGVTAVEFALLSPVLFMMLFGLLDLSHNMYTAQMLQGAIQRAARDSTLEGAAGSATAINANVSAAIQAIVPGATPVFGRKSYASFTKVNRPEDYTDVNGNHTCDSNEPFEDANRNGTWDLDAGATGFGGARDAVLYTVTVTYPRLFPVFRFIPGQSANMTMVAQTVLRNQPFGAQIGALTTTGHCP